MSSEAKQRVLAVDDNHDALYALERILVHHGFEVVTASNGAEAVEKAIETKPAAALLDVMMPEVTGFEAAKQFKAHPELRFIPVILVTARDSLDDVIMGLEHGADDYIVKPFRPEELLARLKSALRLRSIFSQLQTSQEQNRQLLGELQARYDFKNIVGESKAMRDVFGLIDKVSDSDAAVLITGPTGSGKELVARAIHYNSPRHDRAFVAKNCAAFQENLLESELFGHTKGAFTGAHKDKQGLFAVADGGTLFLDEIGEMPASMQAKLLRVLQEGVFMPVGSTTEQSSDVRIVAATNRDLGEMVGEGSFREDLLYRLNVITLELPPLTERKDDVPLLIQHFLELIHARRGDSVKSLSDEALEILKNYSWKGNVRELENEIERMVILGRDDEVLGADLISARIIDESGPSTAPSETGEAGSLKGAIEEVERDMIYQTLVRTKWNKSVTAKELGISRSSLISKVKQYGLDKD